MERIVFGDESSKTVLIQPVDEHDLSLMDSEIPLIRDLSGSDFALWAFKVDNWNEDLSPWRAPAVFGDEAFGEGAEKTLEKVLENCTDTSRKYYIGGYSLAGLFALWSACRSDLFEGVAAASPSVWFPGFTESLRDSGVRSTGVYLSLGDREAKTKNPVMATVADRIRETHELLLARGVKTVLEWNAGNHFKEPDLRMAKGFAWLLKS